MKNSTLIRMMQVLPDAVRNLLQNSHRDHTSDVKACRRIRDHLQSDDSPRKALIAFPPTAWHLAKSQWPNIRYYNYTGLIHSLVRSLNITGHEVDLIDPGCQHVEIGSYDIFLGHGGHCGWLINQLSPATKVFEYVSGAHWKSFIDESSQRYERFFTKYGCNIPSDHRRSMRDLCEGHEQLHQRADVMFTIQCPRMIQNYGSYADKFHFTGLGSYLDPLFDIPDDARSHDSGKRNFIYVGGTGGNLQKGLDVLLEAFSKLPHLNLYIYCKVEDEILNLCRWELSLPNIHYIYHWRLHPFHDKLRRLLTNVFYTVHAPINIGIGTAFMASMGSGLIPCGYVDLPPPVEGAVLAEDWKPDALAQCLELASTQDMDWCRQASNLSRMRYRTHCDPVCVETKFKSMFSTSYLT